MVVGCLSESCIFQVFETALNFEINNIQSYMYVLKTHLKSISIDAGFSKYDFQRFENRAMVAPSMTL